MNVPAFIRSIESVLEARTRGGARAASCDVVFAVRRRLRISDEIREWRLLSLLSTLALLGAFPDYQCRRGVGWVRLEADEGKRAA